jgi:hypothetical protein
MAGELRAFACRPVLVIGFIMLIVVAVVGFFSWQISGYEPDEVGYTHLSLGIAHSLSPITLRYGGGSRLNQLYPLLIAPIWGAFGNVTAFRIAHIWNVLLMASAAIPAYLLAIEVVRRRWAAYLVAALVVFAPWMTLSLAELTEVAAFPACIWALFGMQRALVEPSPVRDLVALGLIALACYGRLQLAILVPILIVAILVHEVGYALAVRQGRRAKLAEALSRMVRVHSPICLLGLAGVVVGMPLLLSGRLSSALGFYGNTLTGVTLNQSTLDMSRAYLAFIVLGMGVLPAIVSVGFFGESLLSPVSRRAHAFASLGAVTVVVLIVQVAEISVRFDEGILQERYVFYIVPLFAVGMCAGLLLTRHPLKMLIGGSVAVAILVATTHYQSARNAFWYQVSPAMTGFYDWIRPMFGASGGPTVDPGALNQLTAGLVVLVVGLLVAVLSRMVSSSRLLASVAVVALLFCGAETVNALWHVVHGNSGGVGYGEGSLRDVDWVDRHVPQGAPVAQVVSNVGGLGSSRGLWEDSEFWNRSITGAYTFGVVSDSYLATSPLRIDRVSGAITLKSGGVIAPSQRYLVTAARGFPVGYAGTVIGHSSDGTLEALRIARPLHAAWAVFGVSGNGWLAFGRPATLRMYILRGEAKHCARVGVTVSLSSLSGSPRSLLLTGAGISRRIRVESGETETAHMRVCSEGAVTPDVLIRNGQSIAASDPQLTLQLRRVTVVPA